MNPIQEERDGIGSDSIGRAGCRVLPRGWRQLGWSSVTLYPVAQGAALMRGFAGAGETDDKRGEHPEGHESEDEPTLGHLARV